MIASLAWRVSRNTVLGQVLTLPLVLVCGLVLVTAVMADPAPGVPVGTARSNVVIACFLILAASQVAVPIYVVNRERRTNAHASALILSLIAPATLVGSATGLWLGASVALHVATRLSPIDAVIAAAVAGAGSFGATYLASLVHRAQHTAG
jgi:uncharacterized membrane protein YesL